MFFMFFFYLRVNQNIVDKNHNKLIQVLYKHIIHERHEIGGGTRMSKGHTHKVHNGCETLSWGYLTP
jgi:hypothetical protein